MKKFIFGIIVVLVIWSITSGSLAGLFSAIKAKVAGRCIITLFGIKYDVTDLQRTHTKGVTFVCGTDMSVVYQGQHRTDMRRMQPYLIKSGGAGSKVP